MSDLNTKKWLICELAFAAASLIVTLYARYHSALAFAIFCTYIFVVVILSIILTVSLMFNRKRMNEAAQRRLSFFVNRLSMPVILWNESADTPLCNDALRLLLQLDPEEADTTDQVCRLLGVECLSSETIRELLRCTGKEVTLADKQGNLHTILWTTSGFQVTDHDCWFISVGSNITETQNMIDALESFSNRLALSESRYALAMELSEIGLLLTEQGSDQFFASEQLREMIGLSEREISYSEFRRMVHPNDVVLYDRFIKTLPKFCEEDSGKICTMELRIRGKENNRYRWYTYRYKTARLDQFSAPIIGGALFDISREREKDALIERLAYVDEVTEIPNRNKLMTMGQDLYSCSKELGVSYYILVLDIDRFHLINDTCGYETGNAVLKDFAHILYKYLSFGGFGARISGDNFALIVRDYGDEELPIKTLELIQTELTKLANSMFPNKHLTCSAGYAKMPQDGNSFAEILERAEFALASSSTHKGTVIGYNSHMHDTIIGESELEKQLADAIEDGQLRLYYQPKVALTNGRIIGVEALVRWIRPDGTIIQPGSFVPLAEESQLISKISQYVLTEACEQNRIWQKMGLPNIVVSVNLTSADFYQGNVRDQVFEVLARTGLDSQWLEIELTESLAIKDLDLALEQMNQLREMGVKLAMDDFGTGYSSLSYIQVLPITLLKLDRSFVMHMEDDEIAREIVEAVIRIAKSKHIETIAEGIETPEQAKLLRLAGCDNAQGYLYGKPMPPEEIEQLMRKNINERQVY